MDPAVGTDYSQLHAEPWNWSSRLLLRHLQPATSSSCASFNSSGQTTNALVRIERLTWFLFFKRLSVTQPEVVKAYFFPSGGKLLIVRKVSSYHPSCTLKKRMASFMAQAFYDKFENCTFKEEFPFAKIK